MTVQSFQTDFNSFKDELASFIFRLTTNRQDTEDIVQDTYIKTFENLHSFEGNSSLKTWVFSIGLNIAKNQLKKQKRWLENTQDYGANLHVQSPEHWERFHAEFNATPEQQYEVKEHINYCFNCINKTLVIEQQICLLLKEVYAFKLAEIMAITELTEGKVKHAIADARRNMVRIFDNRCALVNKQGACHQCTELTGILNPKQNVQIEAAKIQMVKDGHSKNKERLMELRLDIVRGIDPLNAPNSIVNTFMLESAESWVEEGKRRKVLKNPSEK